MPPTSSGVKMRWSCTIDPPGTAGESTLDRNTYGVDQNCVLLASFARESVALNCTKPCMSLVKSYVP